MKKTIPFGKYLLLDRINVGGMAEVFFAKVFGIEGGEVILAIKKILPTMVEDEEFISMFIDEARIAVQLDHRNIVQIYELGKLDENYYIAMEYVPGRDLRALLDRQKKRKEQITIDQALFVARELAQGLDYAHRAKDQQGEDLHIVHRDVSPQNILLSYDGRIKLIDFGIAKAATRSQRTQNGILKGKFGYMSPEQVRGVPIDRRSDVFALGVILYEMLTGERLFVGESDFSILERVRNAEVPSPRKFNAAIPDELERVVLKALTRDPESRYQWASELAADIDAFLAPENADGANRLADLMRQTFGEDLLRERERMLRFSGIERPPEVPPTSLRSFVHFRHAASEEPTAIRPPSVPGDFDTPTTGSLGGTTTTQGGPKLDTDPGATLVNATLEELIGEAPPAVRPRVDQITADQATFEAPTGIRRTPEPKTHTETRTRSPVPIVLVAAGVLVVATLSYVIVHRLHRRPSPLPPVAQTKHPVKAPPDVVVATENGLDLKQPVPAPPVPVPSAPPTQAPPAPTVQVPAVVPIELTIDADPAEAKISIDDALVGPGPYIFTADRGRVYSIRAELPGYRPAHRRERFSENQSVHLALVPIRSSAGHTPPPAEHEPRDREAVHEPPPPPHEPTGRHVGTPAGGGTLIISSTQTARVFVDGKATNRYTPVPPADPLELSSGKHEIHLETDDGKKADKIVHIERGELAKLLKVPVY